MRRFLASAQQYADDGATIEGRPTKSSRSDSNQSRNDASLRQAPPAPPLDALLPEEVARKAEALGVTKAKRDVLTLMILSVLAGAFIGLGAMFSTVVGTGLPDALPFGLARVLPAIAFSLGLILVVVCGAELFTGDVLMAMAWASRQLPLLSMLRAWTIILVGNLIGGVGTALMLFWSDQWMLGNGEVGATAIHIASFKLSLTAAQAFWRGLLCNVLVCLAVWASLAARSVTDKILVVIPPIAAFVAAGFEHSVANFYYLPLAWLIHSFAPDEFWSAAGLDPDLIPRLTIGSVLRTQVPVILGNLIGGACLVALVYWLAYLRPRGRIP
jgi:formate transporter